MSIPNNNRDTCVVMTLCSRPDYTRKVLDALARCDDVDKFPIALLCEPVSDEVISVAAEFTKLPHVHAFVMVGQQQVGCNVNTYSALAYGFDHHTRVIALEDDTVPGRDFLRFMDWGLGQYARDASVFSVCGYHAKRRATETRSSASRGSRLGVGALGGIAGKAFETRGQQTTSKCHGTPSSTS